MIKGRCSVCDRPYEGETVRDLPYLPFCSDRCRLIDLGRWLGGSYRIPSAPTGNEPEDDSGEEPMPPA
ncbi:MAG: DNA gyrase inhibitor YacG [Gemmataceae bacterium]